MSKLSLYEFMFEGKKEHTCENCINEDVCAGECMDKDGDCKVFKGKEERIVK